MSDEKAELAGRMRPTNDPLPLGPPPPYAPDYPVPPHYAAATGEYPPGAYTQMGPQGQTFPQNPAYGGQTYQTGPGQPYPPAGPPGAGPYQPCPQGQYIPPVTYHPGAAGTPGPPPVTYHPGAAGTTGSNMAPTVVIQSGGVIQHPNTFIHPVVVNGRGQRYNRNRRRIIIIAVCGVLGFIILVIVMSTMSGIFF